jgi:hypothetical protein
MIRTVLAAAFLISLASAAYANQPPAPHLAKPAAAIADCAIADADLIQCDDPLVTRGQADLAPQHIAPAFNQSVATA